MARPHRIEFAQAVYHVTARGDRQEAIFLDDQDRLLFIDLLAHSPMGSGLKFVKSRLNKFKT